MCALLLILKLFGVPCYLDKILEKKKKKKIPLKRLDSLTKLIILRRVEEEKERRRRRNEENLQVGTRPLFFFFTSLKCDTHRSRRHI